DDQCPLPFADRREQVRDPHGARPRAGLKFGLLAGVDRCQVVEELDLLGLFRRPAVNRFDFMKARTLTPVPRTDFPSDENSFAKMMFLKFGNHPQLARMR